jgi:hypothetical protein
MSTMSPNVTLVSTLAGEAVAQPSWFVGDLVWVSDDNALLKRAWLFIQFMFQTVDRQTNEQQMQSRLMARAVYDFAPPEGVDLKLTQMSKRVIIETDHVHSARVRDALDNAARALISSRSGISIASAVPNIMKNSGGK